MTAKPPMPADLVTMADAAIARHMRRKFVPELVIEQTGWECPYREADASRWWALLFDVFGTRSESTVCMFLNQLSGLLETDWNEDWRQWVVAEPSEMIALLTMIQAMKPRNEAQAALAAQLVALNLNAMKLSKNTLRGGGGDARSVAILSKAARSFAEGLETMRRLQGERRTTKQTIRVESHKHVHQHVHLNGGAGENGGQPHATDSIIDGGATVSGQSQVGEVVSLPCRSGQARLSDARREQGKRRA